MKVISKKSNRRLVKNGEYEVIQIWNDGTSQTYHEGKCEIDGIGYYKVDEFTTINGGDLPKIRFEQDRNYFKDLKKGDILVSKYDVGKSFVQDQMYLVEGIKTIQHQRKWGIASENYIKFQGFPRWYKFSPWRFKLLSKDKAREISLDEILSDKKSPTILERKKRSIDSVENKNSLLLKILSTSIIDKYRNNLDVLDWAIQKNGSKYGVSREDFDHLMNIPLKDIIKQIDEELVK